MDDVWFTEELIPAEATVEQAVKSVMDVTKASGKGVNQQIKRTARGIVRVDRPRWSKLDPASFLSSGQKARFYLVRLGFQFDVPQEAREEGARFVYARCSAYLWSAVDGQPQPTVYAVIPSDLYEGPEHKVSVKVGPQIKLTQVEASLGEVSTDFTVGVVEPAIVGWPGDDERAPYWELRPLSKTLLGLRHLWLVIEVPEKCQETRMAAMAEGDIQTHRFGLISIGPKERVWQSRPFVIIS